MDEYSDLWEGGDVCYQQLPNDTTPRYKAWKGGKQMVSWEDYERQCHKGIGRDNKGESGARSTDGQVKKLSNDLPEKVIKGSSGP